MSANNPEPLFPLPDRPTATPAENSYLPLSESAPTPRNPRAAGKYLISAAGIAVLLILIAAGVYGTTRESEDAPEDATASITVDAAGGSPPNPSASTCVSPPVVSLDDARLSNSGLVLELSAASGCQGTSVVSGSSVRVTAVDGSTNVAAGLFDFSAHPALLTASGDSRLTLTFPLGTFWMVPSTLTASTSVQLDTASVERSEESPSQIVSISAWTAAPPATGDAETAAAQALRAISDSDRSVVMASLADRWLPQVSSKRPGLVAEGRTWTSADILYEHLQTRVRYPSARLIWSGSWSTFSAPDWWVSVVGETYTSGESANTWCAANNLDRDHCYAKLVSTVRPVDGSTVLQK